MSEGDPLSPVGSCSRGTASIARPARVQPEMSLDLRPFPSPEEQSDQQPEIPLDLRPFPSLEEERDLAAAPLPPGPPPSELDVVGACPRRHENSRTCSNEKPPSPHGSISGAARTIKSGWRQLCARDSITDVAMSPAVCAPSICRGHMNRLHDQGSKCTEIW